jgi:hypothetical protein
VLHPPLVQPLKPQVVRRPHPAPDLQVVLRRQVVRPRRLLLVRQRQVVQRLRRPVKPLLLPVLKLFVV